MFSKFGLRTKLLSLCVVMSAIMLAISAFSYTGMRGMAASYNHVVRVNLPATRHLGELFASYRRVRILLRTLGISGVPKSEMDQAVADVKLEIAHFEGVEKEYADAISIPEERKLQEAMSGEWKQFRAVGEDVLKYYAAGTPDARAKMLEIFVTSCPARAKAFTAAINQLIDYQTEQSKAWSSRGEEDERRTSAANLAFALVGLVGSLSVGFFFSRALSNGMSAIASQLSAGASEVASASGQVSTASQSLSASSTEQSASLQETVASVEEINSMIQKNAENAKRSQSVSETSNQAAVRGRKVVEEMIEAIDGIQGSNDSIAAQIEESNREISAIVQVIGEIGEKTKVINDIVFQTKLLSFNASVEAARAGEHGKGFAVVAEEVGNLAQMSGNAAKEISALLEGSTQKVESIVENTKSKVEGLVRTGRERVGRGTETAKRCGEVLDEIVANVGEVNGLVTEIATASDEQAKGVSEINKAMTQLDQVTQQNSATSQETASASTQLTSQAESLKHIVGTLLATVHGAGAGETIASAPRSEGVAANVVPIGRSKRGASAFGNGYAVKKAVGSETTPACGDSRFDEV